MSNIAGKAYAMNVITPIKGRRVWINKFIFWLAGGFLAGKLIGLVTLSLIHYARWTIVRPSEFPNLGHGQPEEELEYSYMLFFSNFNGSWAQYVDSFSMAIPSGLDLLWFKNVKYPNSIPLTPFQNYITYNQIWSNHYYNSYPMASSNDIKSGHNVRKALLEFNAHMVSPQEFQKKYNRMLVSLQHDLGQMAPTPIVSLASEAVTERRHIDKIKSEEESSDA